MISKVASLLVAMGFFHSVKSKPHHTPEELTACIENYPEYEGDLNLEGKVLVRPGKSKMSLDLAYDISGLLENCYECGIHIHSGKTCEDKDEVGGHYWNDQKLDIDPWTTTYNANKDGTASGLISDIKDGFSFEEHSRHAVVVHTAGGERVGCGVLRKGTQCPNQSINRLLTATIGKYPGYHGELQPQGKVKLRFKGYHEFKFSYNLKGLLPNCENCGIHVHEGVSCSDAGGHYWNAELYPDDPWDTTYDADYYGESRGKIKRFTDEFNYREHVNHAVVIHTDGGERVGCGILTEEYIPVY